MSSYGGYKENRFLLSFFYLWILSIPFYQFNVIGTLSADNILGPILFIIWLISSGTGNASYIRKRHLITVLSIIFLYLFSTLVGLLAEGSFKHILILLWQDVKLVLYLLLPLLCIQTKASFRVALRLLVVDGVIISVASFLQSFGLVDFSFSRSLGGDRLGIEGIVRSAGILTNYGDIAILLTISMLVMYCCWKEERKIIYSSKIIHYGIYSVLAVGILAAQSRNVVISIIVGYFSFYIFSKLVNKQVNVPALLVTLLILAVPLLLIANLVLPSVYTALLGQGGVKASILDRVAQYEYALALITDNFLFGLSGDLLEQNFALISSLHNLWLGLALKGGVFAMLAFLLLFYIVITNALSLVMTSKYLRKEANLVAATSISMLVTSMFYVAHDAHIFWMMMGVTLSLYTLADQNFQVEAGNESKTVEDVNIISNSSVLRYASRKTEPSRK